MRIRESGMPEEKMWNSFFDVQAILKELDVDFRTKDLVEVGCGYGTFTIAASKLIAGAVFAFDIDEDMVSVVQKKIEALALTNVKLELRDVLKSSTGLPADSIDYVMLFNLLHLENPHSLLQEAYRILKKGGRLGVIHWRKDIVTPRGPSLDIRPSPDTIATFLEEAGFRIHIHSVLLEPYHYGFLALK